MKQDSSVISSFRKRNAIIFAAVVVIWLSLDQITKLAVNSFRPGETFAGPFLGLIDFTLVHNSGAAWGMFSNMTSVLALFSLVVCAIIALYLFVLNPNCSLVSAIGLSLVFAGGLGNAIDRFANSYVIDFIRPIFIDFPVFNIADIGVTCGVVMFIIGLIIEWKNEECPD